MLHLRVETSTRERIRLLLSGNLHHPATAGCYRLNAVLNTLEFRIVKVIPPLGPSTGVSQFAYRHMLV